jgi:ribonuclease P protein component
MLKKSQRLTKNFQIVFRKGVKIHTPFFVCRAIPAFDNTPRLAVVVTKKTSKTAVGRNLIRRRLSEAVRTGTFFAELKIPCQIVLIAHRQVQSAHFLKLQSALGNAVEQLNKEVVKTAAYKQIQRRAIDDKK